MMKRRGPRIEPCGTPKRIFRKSLKLEPIFVFCFRLVKYAKMKFSDFISDPYAFNLAISNSCEIQSKAFDRSVNTAAKTPLLSRISEVSRPLLKDSAVSQTLF